MIARVNLINLPIHTREITVQEVYKVVADHVRGDKGTANLHALLIHWYFRSTARSDYNFYR